MKIIQNGDPAPFERCVLALGNFDGVHLGHRKLLETAVKAAADTETAAGVYTFRINSKQCLGARDFALLTTDEEKNGIFEACGLDFICYDDFDSVKDESPEQFCAYIAERFHPAAVVCGENFTFGRNASAGSADLARLMRTHGCAAHIIPHVFAQGVCISSSAVRRLIAEGDMPAAENLLGYRYFIRAKVIHGAKLGRKLGFPTINQLEYSGKAIPKFGVYACLCTIDGGRYKGVVNVGVRPTVSEGEENPPVLFETHLLDFNEDAYGKQVTVEFCKMLRTEKKFSSLTELHENVMKNIDETREYFEKNGFLSPAPHGKDEDK